MSTDAAARRHGWLELLQISGPFVTIPVADSVWPTGLPAVSTATRAQVRAAVSGLLDGDGRTQSEVIRTVLSEILGWNEALLTGPAIPAALIEVVGEHGTTVAPDFAFHVSPEADAEDDELLEPEASDHLDEDVADEGDESEEGDEPGPAADQAGTVVDSPWRLLGLISPWGSHPLARTLNAGWAASPAERLAALLRARNVPIGLVTDGRWWAVVSAPRGKPMGVAVWDASLWSEEPETLAAFVALLERRRFVGVAAADRLPAILSRSAEAQEDVTTALGGQVRTAVEMLVRRFDALDRNSGGQLLRDVNNDDLYAGIVTVMMRIVFLLFAEERRLLPSDDDAYDRGYSVGRLVEQLRQRASLNGEQTLEHRTGAWHRLLALTRALHSGVHHQDLRLPAYGGALFDPDRYPWLEVQGSTTPPVDDLTVLRMLEAVQFVRIGGESRRLSFRTLDVEQIGYVYEGLLELEVRTATEPVLFLRRRPGVVDFVFESEALQVLVDLPEWTASTYLGKKKATAATRKQAGRLLAPDGKDASPVVPSSPLERRLGEELAALGPLFRRDESDRPVITPPGGRYLAASSRRTATGAYYTPRSLAEEIVKHTLEPLVYRPGPLQTLDRDQWVLRPSAELERLRVADIAMGSGAFLVAACRFLADRWVEARDTEGDLAATRSLADRTEGAADTEVDEIILAARREIAEHCLYGVDINPLAVEMAKLSLWLVTMDRERPFGFLDDRLVCGDSLLGIASMDQLETLHLDPVAGRALTHGTLDFGHSWRTQLAGIADIRRRIVATPVVTVRDVELKAIRLHEAIAASATLSRVADALTGAGMLAAGQSVAKRRATFLTLQTHLSSDQAVADDPYLDTLTAHVQEGRPAGKERRRPFHWPVAFPEVFADTSAPGFDAIIGNPPFQGGKKISGALGSDYLAWLMAWDGRGARGNTDLAARFVLRAARLLKASGQLGYVTTNTLVEGDTLAVGLLQLEGDGWHVRRAVSAHAWPSRSASLSVVEVWLARGKQAASAVLDSEAVPHLGVDLQPYLTETGRPERLSENEDIAFIGSYVLGLGFTMTDDEAANMIAADPKSADVIFPYIIGADLNRRPDCSASRSIINFHDWSLERAARYELPIERVRQFVKPEREAKKARDYRHYWWRYGRRGADLYEEIRDLDHVLALSRVGNTLLPVRVPYSRLVFSEQCVVFAMNKLASLSMLSSSAHQVWAIRYTSTLGTGIRYAPSDVFLTWPRPAPTVELEQLGQTLDAERRKVMLGRSLGLTKLHNQINDPAVTDPAIVRLREIHAEIDQAMLDAYGWTELDLEIGHHPTKIGTRWTVSPRARFELLDRLLIENHRRAREQDSTAGSQRKVSEPRSTVFASVEVEEARRR
ncbi:hypothetical protein FHX74_000435 [Friedmanniella endophytica]|uniref:site-specific DNA-methyltransferase (adenine-specific) n=1 Tax=Microlunatus kandeliicorticis TaxID=1759536 RepID=A0A7W3P4F9_9ACTN|nr:DNA methyltransferase [Microlunatus kandeliicorticis]MBA8792841.1 hypothetical protein [Microlunatus kandeliicorticis]